MLIPSRLKKTYLSGHKVVCGLMVVTLLGGVIGWRYVRQSAITRQTIATERVLPVATIAIAAVSAYESAQTYTGEIVAGRSSQLGFERTGQLLTVSVNEGDLVTQDMSLARLDTRSLDAQSQQLLARRDQAAAKLQELQVGARPEELAVAQAQVTEISAQLALEQNKSQRRQSLYAAGAISREQLEESNSAATSLEARLAQSQSHLSELRNGNRVEQIDAQAAIVAQVSAEIDSLENEFEKSILRAPFDGMIATRSADEGTIVSPSQPVLRLVENHSLEAEVGIPTSVVEQIQPGSSQQVSVDQSVYEVTIAAVKPELDAVTRTATAILKFALGVSLRPGQLVDLEIVKTTPLKGALDESAEGYWLPTTALLAGSEGLWYCYTLATVENSTVSHSTKAAFEVERSAVEIVQSQSDRVLVTGNLESGDQVIKSGLQRVTAGQRVRPLSTSASNQAL